MMRRPCFFKKLNALIGLEFTAHSIQWTELSRNKEGYHLESYTQISINVKNPLLPNETEQTEITHVLKQAITKLNPRTRQTCIGVDYSSVLFKTVELDKNLSDAEILCYLKNQAEKHFNFLPNELMLDFNRLESSSANQGLIKIQWVAARHHDLAPWLNILIQAGLEPVIVDINSCALQRSAIFALNYEMDGVIAAVHIYEESFLLIIFNQETPLFVRHERFLVDSPDLDCVFRCLQFNSWRHEKPISQILLSGNIIIDHKILEKKVGIKVVTLSPFSEIANCHPYAISIGLALRVSS